MVNRPAKYNILDQKSAWIAVIALFILALGVILRANEEFYADLLTTAEYPIRIAHRNSARAQGLAWIEIRFNGGKKRLFEGEVDGHTYPFSDAIRAIQDANILNIAIARGNIISIEGERAREGAWAIRRNGKSVKDSVESLAISQGDTYTLFHRE